jgi:hypothetical protein
LPDQLGETEGEDDEVDAGDAESRRANQTGQHCRACAANKNENRKWQVIEAKADRIGADAEECSRGQRNIMGWPGEQRPRRTEGGIEDDVERQREIITLVVHRQSRSGGDNGQANDARKHFAERQAVHACCLPKMPCGRNSKTNVNSA